MKACGKAIHSFNSNQYLRLQSGKANTEVLKAIFPALLMSQ